MVVRRCWWLVAAIAACGGGGSGTGPPGGVTVGFETSAADADETDGTVSIGIALSEMSNDPVFVTLSVAGGTATSDVDYTIGEGVLPFAPGALTWEVPLIIVADTEPEPAETVILSLSDPMNASLGVATETFTIRANQLPRITFAQAIQGDYENDPNAKVTINLMPASADTVTVDYTIAGTATTADYALQPGTVTFAPGETSHDLLLGLVNDSLDEDNETIVLTLDNPKNAMFGLYSTMTESIGDDDFPPEVAFAIDHSSIPEGNSGVTHAMIDVVLDQPSGKTVTVAFSVTPSSTATSPSDYAIATPSPLTFAPGVVSQSITVDVVGDTLQDGSETVQLAIDSATNASPTGYPQFHTLTLSNDDCFGSGTFIACPDAINGPTVLPTAIGTGDLSPDCAPDQLTGWLAEGQPAACFVVATDITVDTTLVYGTRPLVLVATNSITINTLLDASSSNTKGIGPAANYSNCVLASAPGTMAAGAGGSFMSKGGDGGAHSSPAGSGGLAAAADASIPAFLRGGCPGEVGGGVDAFYQPPGPGGGAIYLVSGGTITIQPGAVLDASGGGGKEPGQQLGGAGGGTGGMIVLDAPTIIATSSFVLANGGGGSEGGSNGSSGTPGANPTRTAPMTPAPGGSGTQGGDGGNGFASGSPATAGAAANNNSGGGGGGGGAGYIRVSQPLTGASVSPPPS